MPADVIEAWKRELGLDELSRHSGNSRTSRANRKLRQRIEKYLDCGYGECVLKRHENADLVAKALQHFDGTRYQLFAWVIMPNHVHVLCRQKPGWPLSNIVRSWKSFTAHAINKSLGRTGAFWQADYFDRYIRNEAHFLAVAHYIETNPVSAGLCATATEWPYSSIHRSADVSSADRSANVSSADWSADVSSADWSADVSSADWSANVSSADRSADVSSASPAVRPELPKTE
jgi:REP element-mobilizing transposase RayT